MILPIDVRRNVSYFGSQLRTFLYPPQLDICSFLFIHLINNHWALGKVLGILSFEKDVTSAFVGFIVWENLYFQHTSCHLLKVIKRNLRFQYKQEAWGISYSRLGKAVLCFLATLQDVYTKVSGVEEGPCSLFLWTGAGVACMPCGKQGLLDSEEHDLGHGSHLVPGSPINIEESQHITTDRKLGPWDNLLVPIHLIGLFWDLNEIIFVMRFT